MGLPFAGHKDNHSGLMTRDQMEAFRTGMRVRPGHEWDRFEGLDLPPDALEKFISGCSFAQPLTPQGRVLSPAVIPVPPAVPLPKLAGRKLSTQAGFGEILGEIGRPEGPWREVASRIVTTSPDVTVSTSLGPWVNRRGLFDRHTRNDVFRDTKVASTQRWGMSPSGQHIELGIAEQNLFLLLGSAGLSHALNGARLLPIGTVYDPFVNRGLDALIYACYQDARFLLVSTPSGISRSIRPCLAWLSTGWLPTSRPMWMSLPCCCAGRWRICRRLRARPSGCGFRRVPCCRRRGRSMRRP
jgi:pyruvate dehydrogenase E1 component